MSPTDADEILRAQLEYLRSDDRLRELAAMAVEMTAEERLEQAWAMSASAQATLDALPADARARAEAYREPLGADAEEVLPRLAALWSPTSSDVPDAH
jgi:hypothetical protein